MDLFHGVGAAVVAVVLSVTHSVDTERVPPPEAIVARVPACQPRALPVPAGVSSSAVTGGDHSGRYLVGRGTQDGERIALRWRDGRVSVVDTSSLRPYIQVDLTDGSAAGVVGNITIDNSSFRREAFVVRDGVVRKLPGLKPSDETVAEAINARGDIVGTSQDNSASPVVWRAVIWPAARPGTVRELVADASAPTWTQAVDIDDDGTVLGLVWPPTAGQYSYVWPAAGRGRPLAAPIGYSDPAGTAVHDGTVVGVAIGPDGWGVPMRWQLSTGRATVISGGDGRPVGVNPAGTIATTASQVIHRSGRVQLVDGVIAVLDDRGVVAGTTDQFTGSAVTWTGC